MWTDGLGVAEWACRYEKLLPDWLAGDSAELDPLGGLYFFPAVGVPVVDVAEAGFEYLQAVEEVADFLLLAEAAEGALRAGNPVPLEY